MRAKQGEPEAWAASRFEALERYLHEALDEQSRFRLKLSSPLAVGDVLARRYLHRRRREVGSAGRRLDAIDDIDRQLAHYRSDLDRGFELRMQSVEKVLVEMESRGHQSFDDTLRLGRLFDLVNRSRVQSEFEEKVVADAPQQIERRVSELIDWLVDQDYRQWQAVSERLAVRQRRVRRPHSRTHRHRRLPRGSGAAARIAGPRGPERRRWLRSPPGSGEDGRRRPGVGGGDGRHRRRCARSRCDRLIAATTAAADITGFLMASVVAAVGFLIIPARRRRARAEIRARVSTLIADLCRALGAEFTRAQERSAQRFADAMGPYTRFVRAERDRWEGHRAALSDLRGRMERLLQQIQS